MRSMDKEKWREHELHLTPGLMKLTPTCPGGDDRSAHPKDIADRLILTEAEPMGRGRFRSRRATSQDLSDFDLRIGNPNINCIR